jgi:hypothetical protein
MKIVYLHLRSLRWRSGALRSRCGGVGQIDERILATLVFYTLQRVEYSVLSSGNRFP